MYEGHSAGYMYLDESRDISENFGDSQLNGESRTQLGEL